VLCVPDEVIAHLLLGKKLAPKFSKDFPAQLLTTTKTWDDLVLNEQTARHLQEIEVWLGFNHVLMNGWGLSRLIRPGFKALFHGAPGTGKSLTASLLGQRTGREVYRIDLSMIVSKYIGETEKNLARVFDRAENKNWILFFDEADALFGKRTAVSSSHDRYANQEVSYLLQRIEEFNGLVILASNLKNNMDDAFLRRFNSIIYYPSPRQEERYLIWKKGFSPATQLEEQIRLELVAQKYDLSGGHIVNVIHYCSLMAASRGDSIIRMADLTEGLRKEYAKLGRTI
jgi:SpoVK/Ycf46/Vps4 family AAA+-type ATPase